MTPRKPRKMPKNQQAYPKKPRLVEVFGDELDRIELENRTGVSAPHVYSTRIGKYAHFFVNADELRKWRALRNPPTSGAVE